MSYTKNDIFILDAIRTSGGISELAGVPISTIVKKSKLSHTKVRNTVKILQSRNLIKEGFMQKNAKTYFITSEGELLLSKLILCSEASTNLREFKGDELNE